MKIKLESSGGSLNFLGTNERGQTVQFSGNKEAVSPMESVLMAAAACSSIDVETILLKMKQGVTHIEVQVEAERAKDVIPAVFTKIHLHYLISGDVKTSKAEKAVQMSIETYCSVSKMLEKSAEITHSFEVKELPSN